MNEQRFNYAQSENRSDYSEDKRWETIDWKTAEEYINRLQFRIVKAVEKGNWNLVKRLQYLLTHSFYAKALAVRKVNIDEFALDPPLYFHKLVNDKDLQKTDLGWDIYPEGIYTLCRKYYSKYKLPIYITENGISDKYDNRRPEYIVNHLAKAINEGIQVDRYYHWTLMDNFEWLEGESANFGLYKCDFRTQERIPRQSAELYARICKEKQLTEEMITSLYPNTVTK